MILIIGGACQGKTAYAREHFAEGYTLADDYHLRVKEQLRAGQEPLREAQRLLSREGSSRKKELVIISNEIGYGLVPIDAFERAYREQSGRVNCYLAGEADQVIRVICGIGTRIK